MERNFALGSIITGAVVIMGILFCRLFSGLYRGWDIFMMLDPLFFYTLLIMAGVSFLKTEIEQSICIVFLVGELLLNALCL